MNNNSKDCAMDFVSIKATFNIFKLVNVYLGLDVRKPVLQGFANSIRQRPCHLLMKSIIPKLATG